MTVEHLTPDAEGLIQLPAKPGLGITPNIELIRQYVVDCEIRVGRQMLYKTPELRA